MLLRRVIMNESIPSHARCKNCEYSRKTTVVNVITKTMADGITDPELKKWADDITKPYEVTTCHLQGKPQAVNAENDWCYQWKNKEKCDDV